MVLLDNLVSTLSEGGPLQYVALLLGLPTVIYAVIQALVAVTSYKLNVPVYGVDKSKWFPVLQARFRYMFDGNLMIKEAYSKYPDDMFQIPTLDQNLLLLPVKYVEELKSLPEDVLSPTQALANYFLGDYTTLDVMCFGHAMWSVTRISLTQRLGLLAEPSYEVCSEVFREEFPSCPDWKPLVIHPKTLEMIGRMTSRTLVGLELSRDPVWHEALMGYAGSIFEASVKLKVIPSIIRPIYALFMPLLWKIRRCKWNARKILFPEIQRRRAEREGGPAVQSKERVSDLLDWLDDVSKGDELLPESILKRELALGFGAIHTTTNHTVNVILDLAARWEEYAPALREEIEEAMKEDDGEIRKATFTKLSKLDSFMKESQRMNPLSSVAFTRTLLQKVTLSDGFVLPRGVDIAVPTAARNVSANLHENADKFDGFRFHRMRQGGGSSSYLFSSTSLELMTFGHGKYACPGRFFAGLQSKIILVHLLLNYDLKIAGDGGRPKNLYIADASYPDPGLTILFKNRDSSKK